MKTKTREDSKLTKDTPIYYIKLGSSGRFTRDCLDNDYARLGFDHIPHELCENGEWDGSNLDTDTIEAPLDQIEEKWEKVLAIQNEFSGTPRQDVTAIRRFYEANEDTVWITFHGGKIYWTRLEEGVHQDGTKKTYRKIRDCVDGWRNQSIEGESLDEFRISGQLLQVKNFRGTICEPSGREIARCLINGEIPADIERFDEVTHQLRAHVKKLVQDHLPPDQLECLLDLIFQSQGFKRREVGGHRETVDIELWAPLTQEVTFVQVKARASYEHFQEFLEEIEGFEGNKCYFVVANPDNNLKEQLESGQIVGQKSQTPVELVGPNRLSEWTIDSGLLSWVRDNAW